MTERKLKELAFQVDTAAARGDTIDQLTKRYPELTVDDAYRVQVLSVDRRLERGERLVGMKMGLTSKAKMEQVGVHEPIFGRLTDTMMIPDGGIVETNGRCHPRIEPEVAFIMDADVKRPVSDPELLGVVRGVCGALEIIDSRYRDFKFTLPDVVADNTSASGFVLGTNLVPLNSVNLGNLGIILEQNGTPVQFGSSAAIYEHPFRSLSELVRMLARSGGGLRKNDIVLAGGATAAVPVSSGDHVRAVIDELGSVEVRVS